MEERICASVSPQTLQFLSIQYLACSQQLQDPKWLTTKTKPVHGIRPWGYELLVQHSWFSFLYEIPDLWGCDQTQPLPLESLLWAPFVHSRPQRDSAAREPSHPATCLYFLLTWVLPMILGLHCLRAESDSPPRSSPVPALAWDLSMLSGHHVHCLVGLFTPVFSCLVLHVAEKVAFSMFSVGCRAVLL